MERERFNEEKDIDTSLNKPEKGEPQEGELSGKEFLQDIGDTFLQAEREINRAVAVHQKREDPQIGKKIEAAKQAFFRKTRQFLPLILLASLDTQHGALSKATFADHQRADQELRSKGITTEQRRAYKPGISELLYQTITPKGYQTLGRVLQEAPQNLLGREQRVIPAENESDIEYEAQKNPDREDAWRLYLGLPQEHGTFEVSEYQPEKSSEDKYYYKIHDWATRFAQSLKSQEVTVSDAEYAKTQLVPALLRILDEQSGSQEPSVESYTSSDGIPWKPIVENGYLKLGEAVLLDAPAGNERYNGTEIGVMAAFKLSKGHDDRGEYLSYYDRWDLAEAPTEGKQGFLGKPFEIYDRLYYNPETKEIIDPENEAGE